MNGNIGFNVWASSRIGGGLAAIAAALSWAPSTWAQEVLDAEEDRVGGRSDIVVTGKQIHYKADTASAGTKIDAPLRDVPQSIQVMTREMLDDLAITRAADLIKNVSGIYREGAGTDDRFVFRGFTTSEFLRDGFPDRNKSFRDTAASERVEILKGPASVLYGRLEPGGTLNYVTKRPQFQSAYSFDVKVDNWGLLRPTADLDWTNAGGTLGLRVNAAYETGGNFRDFSFSDRKFGAAVLTWQPNDGTSLSFEAEAMNDRRRLDPGLPLYGRGPVAVPVSRTVNEPDDEIFTQSRLVGYTLNQEVAPSWKVRHALRLGWFRTRQHEARAARSTTLVNGVRRHILQEEGDPRWDGFVGRQASLSDSKQTQITAQVELIGGFEVLGMAHKFLVGVDVDHFTKDSDSLRGAIVEANAINVFAPVYGTFTPVGLAQESLSDSSIRTNAIYAQDLIEVTPRWKVLIGARFDDSRSKTDDKLRGTIGESKDNQLSPRAGVVWQPNDNLSLYGSYSMSFVPVIGQSFEGVLFRPRTGKQVEGGVKGEWLEGRLGATVSIFRIVQDNVSVTDPDNPGFSLQTGQTRSEGIEFDMTGSPVRGLRIIGNFSYAKVQITKDPVPGNIGRRPRNVPTHGGGLSASYDFQGERLRGFGARLGMHYVGERLAETNITRPPSFLPSYVRWDAGLTYKTQRWRIALSVDNLFDTAYYAAINNNLVFPGASRTASLSLRYDF